MKSERQTIILVDDEPTNLMVGSNALDEHYDVLTLNSSARLLNVLEKTLPDLILLDIEMPDMNGYEVMGIIKSRPEYAHIPVIFLTAKSDYESELKGLALGAADYIFKPFSPPLLRKRIENQLLLESQRQELTHFNNNLLEMVHTKTETVVELQNAVLRTMAELVEFRDKITGGHIQRTQAYLKIMLDAMKKANLYESEIATWDMDLVFQSAQLHDVGKIAIKDGILQKPCKLTPEEFALVKEHTTFGVEVIDKIKGYATEHAFLEYARTFALSHHERWDGSGYPNGLKGEDIPLLGRVLAIADVYDALVSERPYKKPYTHDEANKIIIESKGTHFDPAIVDIFITVSWKFRLATDFYRKYGFNLDLIGSDMAEARPTLGNSMRVEVYRLFQFTMRDAIEQAFGTEATDRIFYTSGVISGKAFYEKYLSDFTDPAELGGFARRIDELFREFGIGIFRMESFNPETLECFFTVDEDLDSSRLPDSDDAICIYSEGFIAGTLENFTGKVFNVKAVDRWGMSGRTCRFQAVPA